MSLEIETRGLQEMIAKLGAMDETVDQAAMLAVNDAADFAKSAGSKQILNEINYPRNYLRGEDGRLSITKRAKRGDLEATVSGRDRATSLARFASTAQGFGRQHGVNVQVKRGGGARRLKSGFYIKLKKGKTFDGENFNVGLAVRVKPGQRLSNSRAAVDLGNGLFLLYGPSVDQAFQGVAADIVDDVSDRLETEFLRQFGRLG